MLEPDKRTAKGDKVDIQLAIWKGNEQPILCIHGLTANSRCWDTIANRLSPSHQVIAMDLRGRGLSDKPDSGYSALQHCQDIKCLLDDLGLKKVILMGHSLGAFIAANFAAMHPERVEKMILVDGGGKLSEEQTNNVLSGIAPALKRLGRVFPSFDSYKEHLMKAPFNNPWSTALETYFRYEVENVSGGICSRVHPKHIAEEITALAIFDVSETYEKITCPVLILKAPEGMLSDNDILLPDDVIKTMQLKIAQSQCVAIPNLNHYSIIFQPNETRDNAILSFLNE